MAGPTRLTRAGVASVLNEIGELTHLGFEINQKNIPLDEQVEGACEMLGLGLVRRPRRNFFSGWQELKLQMNSRTVARK